MLFHIFVPFTFISFCICKYYLFTNNTYWFNETVSFNSFLTERNIHFVPVFRFISLLSECSGNKYMFKVKIETLDRQRREICSKFKIKTAEWRHMECFAKTLHLTSFWCSCYYLSTYFTPFLVFLLLLWTCICLRYSISPSIEINWNNCMNWVQLFFSMGSFIHYSPHFRKN